MKVLCMGGGPAGLYLAISMKLRDPNHEVTILERNRSGDTFGWGVVLSDDALGNMERNDPVSTAATRRTTGNTITVRNTNQRKNASGNHSTASSRKFLSDTSSATPSTSMVLFTAPFIAVVITRPMLVRCGTCASTVTPRSTRVVARTFARHERRARDAA